MKTQIVTDVYTFDLLSDKAKEKARDWYRKSPANDDFYATCVIEDAKTVFISAGWEIRKVYYSGFSSQGYGACFEGSWSAKAVNVAAMKENAPLDVELHRITEELAKVAAHFPLSIGGVKQSGHYYHEQCTQFSFELEDKAHSDVVSSVEDAFIEASRDAMRWIYRTLEKEWEYQNSDETVDDNILANDYTFTAQGNRFG